MCLHLQVQVQAQVHDQAQAQFKLTNFQLWGHPSRALVLLRVLIELDTEVEAQVLELLGSVSAAIGWISATDPEIMEGYFAGSLLTESLPEGVFVDRDGRHGGRCDPGPLPRVEGRDYCESARLRVIVDVLEFWKWLA